MTDQEQTLLVAVIAAPADDLPRLMLADWWEEQGQPERADFVRVQVELARRVTFGDFQPELAPLRRRERELLGLANKDVYATNYYKWQPEVLKPLAAYGLFFRGFVEEVTMPWSRDRVTAIRYATPLRLVQLTTRPTPDEMIDMQRATWHRRKKGAYTALELLSLHWPGVEFVLAARPAGGDDGGP